VLNLKWKQGKKYELNHWSQWFDTEGSLWKKDYASRLDPDQLLQDHIIAALDAPEGTEVSILDVGAGPLTLIGKIWKGRAVNITAVDPLAHQYLEIIKKHNIKPLVTTQFGEVEKLSKLFPVNTFDLVHIQNALDHCYDPMLGITEMVKVAKVNAYTLLGHFVNEGEREKYVGFHQWNFCGENNNFIIWNKSKRINVNDQLKGIADVVIDLSDDDWINVKIKKLK
jgi:ubiquinone/menaquinone biosynthesis C-methylase UbiE